nr:response regulator [Deltaproteobacteria bacterium]
WMMTNLQMAHDELGAAGLRSRERDGLRQTVEDALQGGRRVMSIVRDLKTLSRDSERVGHADVHAALDLACRVASRQIEVRARLVRDYGHVPSVQAPAGRLGQVFLNLLVNAARAIPEDDPTHHRITLRTRVRDDQVEVMVRDDGRGIPRSVLPHIFDPFYTTRGDDDGTGLGLSITRSIVDGLGGSIDVHSREGDGATFTVRLPIAERGSDWAATSNNEPARIASPRRPQTVAPGPLRVLVIDDEPLLGKSLRRALPDHDVVVTEDPAHGLELCGTTDFDVIICDLMMPVIGGQDVYEHLQEHAPELAARVIFMTGGAFTPSAQRFIRTVDNIVLTKPFAPVDLREAIDVVLDQHHDARRDGVA